jgi:hypothetical protein
MIEIKDLLIKFDNILLSEGFKKESIKNAICSIVDVKINNEDIKIKNNIVYLNIRPIYKNEIFLKKDLINLKLKELLGKKAPGDLR